MKQLKPLLLAISFCFSIGTAYAQSIEDPTERTFTRKQLIEDYDILYASLTNYHPTPFLYTSESDFKVFYEKQRASFPETLTEREFYIAAQQLIAILKCGHTSGDILSTNWFKSMIGKNVLLPFVIQIVDNKVYITGILDETCAFNNNDELLSIDGTPIQDILQEMAAVQERDGNTFSYVNEVVVKKFRLYYLFLRGVRNEFLVEYKLKSGEVKQAKVIPTSKKMKEIPKPVLPAHFIVRDQTAWSVFALDTTHNIAYLKINKFLDRKEYKAYYKRVFNQLDQSPNTQLIIDLRDNTGGYFRNGNRFLSYFASKKFEFNFQRPKRKIEKNKHVKLDKWNKLTKLAFSLKPSKHRVKGQKTHTFTFKPNQPHFKGKVNVITNGITFSQAALAAAQLKQQGAVFFGTETGGGESSTNAMVQHNLVLPNSAFKAKIAYYQAISNSTKGEFGYGVKPNYEIHPGANTIEDEILIKVVHMITTKR